MSWDSELRKLAADRLPAEVASAWSALIRPAARLVALDDGTTGPVAGYLGGDPELPAGLEWPVWAGHGPLTFVAAVDCAALPTSDLDVPLPADGTLLFFYFDGQLDGGGALVLPGEPDSAGGARVLHVPAGTEVSERSAPEGIEAYHRIDLTVRLVAVGPVNGHPVLHRTTLADGRSLDTAADSSALEELLWDVLDGDDHHVGGYARPVQYAVEFEVARGILGNEVSWEDPRLVEEGAEWTLLAQIDTTGDMMWGDGGTLYWLIKPDDLAARRFDRARFTWQCA